MLILENIKLAFKALLTNKMRALLTMLGIIIGIGSVIAIMTVSSSLTSSISSSFQEMGANNVTVGVKQSSEETEQNDKGMVFGGANKTVSMEEDDMISDEMINQFKSEFSDRIDAVAISESVGSGTVKDASDYAYVSITGINEEYYTSGDVTLLAGRRIKDADIEGNKNVIMVSDLVIENMFDGNMEDALWQKINVEIDGVYYYYYIVGIYQYSEEGTVSSSTDEDTSTTAYIPITVAKEQLHSEEGYSQITVVTSQSVSDVDAFATQVEKFFGEYYIDNEDYEISTTTMSSMTESMNEMIDTVAIAIAFIAGISLLVGGIGVMNIMLVSITERTREIGTRKALGAKNSSIRLQFIIEAVILCMVGGVIGVLIGFGLGAVAASVMGYSATAPVAAIIFAVAFSMIIGIFFGYYPANKAAKLNPIDALRYE